MIEPRTGVYLGNPTARVRDELWDMALTKIKEGSILQIWSDSRVAQGYRYRQFGDSDRVMIDMEGLGLVLRPGRLPKNKRSRRPKGGG